MSTVSKIGLGVLALLLLALPLVVAPYSLQTLIFVITYSMLGLGFALSMKVGLPRFDVVAWWGIGAYTTALLMQRGVSFWPTLLVGGLIAVLLGWLFYSISLRRGMIVFLMFGMVVTMGIQVIYSSLDFFGGWNGTGIVPQVAIGSFIFDQKQELYYLGIVFLAVNLLVYYLLFNSKIGRAWNAIASSTKLTASAGIDVFKYRLANVLIGNFFLALSGGFFVAYSRTAVPGSFGFAATIYVMMYVVVGGLRHSLSGPLIGALIVTYISEFLRGSKELAPIINSGILILIIIFMPQGFLGLIDRWARPWFTRKKWPDWLKRQRQRKPEVFT